MKILPLAIITINLALVFHTVGVWSEKFAGRMKPWHLLMFWIGFVFDTTGTTLMAEIAGQLEFDLHGITGMLAIVLMLGHAIWASVVLFTKQEKRIQSFHRLSVFVWLVWLVPFLTGMINSMIH